MWRVVLALAIFALMVGCKDEPTNPEPPDAEISLVNAPEFLLCQVDSFYLYSVRVENLDVEFVTCTITKPNGAGTESIDLYDDGNAVNRPGPDYASPTSLDGVPNNGTFTRGINGSLLCQSGEGEYRLHFVTVGGSQTLELPELAVTVRNVDECAFGNVTQITTLPACFDSLNMAITVIPDVGVEIDSVRALWYSGDTLWWSTLFEKHATDWKLNFAPNLFACTPSGANYSLVFEAFTQFGLNCALTVSENIFFENSLPNVSNPQLADTLYRPLIPGHPDTLEFFVRNDDCEIAGTANSQAVLFEVSRNDTQHFGRTTDFFLRDDGIPPDVVSGDGLASSFLLVDTSTVYLNNVYYFRFFSIDCSSGDTSNYLLDSVRIIVPGALAIPAVRSSDLGFLGFN
jgi:hypothetical protein